APGAVGAPTGSPTGRGPPPERPAAGGPLPPGEAWGPLAGCGAHPTGAASIATPAATAATHRIMYLPPPRPAAPRLIRDAHPAVDRCARRRGRVAGLPPPGSARRASCSRAPA